MFAWRCGSTGKAGLRWLSVDSCFTDGGAFAGVLGRPRVAMRSCGVTSTSIIREIDA